MESLVKSPNSVQNINLTLFAATASLVVASKIHELHALSYVRTTYALVNDLLFTALCLAVTRAVSSSFRSKI
jgi:hypothetical protein